MIDRRNFLVGAIGALASTSAWPDTARTAQALSQMESKVGGRLGVHAVNTGTGRELSHRPDERFAMCSTFKWLLAADVLHHSDRRKLSLDERVSYGPQDLLDYAPVTRSHASKGSMTIGDLAAAAVTLSDNTAANLLLKKVGGPSGFTKFVRAQGDPVTRLDRIEPYLNGNEKGDPRDTTSPRAQVGLMRQLLCGDALTAGSRDRLLSWLRASETGRDRLRAGLPSTWLVGDKTGTGHRGAVNDVAIAVPPGRPPILIAVYLDGADSDLAAAAHAEVGALVARELA